MWTRLFFIFAFAFLSVSLLTFFVLVHSHMCMVMRGVEKVGSSTITRTVLGSFESDKQTRAEFFELMNRGGK